jgi:hypothetical protein
LSQVFRQCTVKGHPREKIENPLVISFKQHSGLLKVAGFYGIHYLLVGYQFRDFCQNSC